MTGNPPPVHIARKRAVWQTLRKPAQNLSHQRLLLLLPHGHRPVWAPARDSTFLQLSTLLPTSPRAWRRRQRLSDLTAHPQLSTVTFHIPSRGANRPPPRVLRLPPSELLLHLRLARHYLRYEARRRRKDSFRIKLVMSSEATPAPSIKLGIGREG